MSQSLPCQGRDGQERACERLRQRLDGTLRICGVQQVGFGRDVEHGFRPDQGADGEVFADAGLGRIDAEDDHLATSQRLDRRLLGQSIEDAFGCG